MDSLIMAMLLAGLALSTVTALTGWGVAIRQRDAARAAQPYEIKVTGTNTGDDRAPRSSLDEFAERMADGPDVTMTRPVANYVEKILVTLGQRPLAMDALGSAYHYRDGEIEECRRAISAAIEDTDKREPRFPAPAIAEALRDVLAEIDVVEVGNPPLRHGDAVNAVETVAARHGIAL